MNKKSSKKKIRSNVTIVLSKDTLMQLPLNKSITYKQICEILKIKYHKGGEAKNVQLDELKRYIKYEIKPNNKIVIYEIYETPEKKKYIYPKNAIYAECIEKILKKYLSGRINDNGITYIYSQRLYLILGMINNDYIFMQKNHKKEELKEDLRVNYGWTDDSVKDSSIDFYINNFFERTKNKFQSIIDTSLKSLKNQRLLEYATSYCLNFEEIDENGNSILYSSYTEDKQTQIILKIERNVLLEMGYKTEYEAVSGPRSNEYYSKITNNAKEYFPHLKSLYRCHKLIYNLDDMQDAVSSDEAKEQRYELNEKVLNFINKQANKNYQSTIDIVPEEGMKYGKNYTITQHYLSDKLMKIK